MDGSKIGIGASFQFRLGLAMTLLLFVAALLIGAIGYYSTMHDAHDMQDDHLIDMADMVDAGNLTVEKSTAEASAELEDPASHVIIERIDPAHAGVRLGLFPDSLEPGMHDLQVQQAEWRVYVRQTASHQKIIVGQLAEVRNEIARHAGARTVVRVLAIIPFLLVFQIVILRWMLRPLKNLALEMNQRSADDMHELSQHELPAELQPFVGAINGMLRRIAAVFDQQRRFVADAAHELRSPLTALSLQTQNLAMQEMSLQAQLKLADFARGIQRANELVDQLLSMARAQLSGPARTGTTSVQQVVRQVFEELMPLADYRGIELGLELPADVTVSASSADLITVVRNLVDNAIRYSDEGGRVDVSVVVQGDAVLLSVSDNGPGIPVAEQTRVFDPFYRLLGSGQTGSGLGLSIVKSIVANLRGEVTIGFSDVSAETGTVVTLKLPLAVAT